MTTLTLHADDAFAITLRDFARKTGKSMNQTLKDLLAVAIDVVADGKRQKRNDLGRFFGAMPCDDDDLKRFESSQNQFSKVDDEMWE